MSFIFSLWSFFRFLAFKVSLHSLLLFSPNLWHPYPLRLLFSSAWTVRQLWKAISQKCRKHRISQNVLLRFQHSYYPPVCFFPSPLWSLKQLHSSVSAWNSGRVYAQDFVSHLLFKFTHFLEFIPTFPTDLLDLNSVPYHLWGSDFLSQELWFIFM